MDLITADMECFYDNDYTLSKLSTEAYLRDPRMEEILWSIKINDHAAFWVLPDRAEHFFKNEVDWPNTALICHHSHFDGARLNWAHDCRPALHIDTLSMARVLDGPKAGNSLHDLCLRHGVGAKGDYVTFAKGKHLDDFSADEIKLYGQYGCNDADRTYDLAQIFLPQLPESELRLIDLNVRMFTEPAFVGDVTRLRGAVASERARKIELLTRIGLVCEACQGQGRAMQLLLASGDQVGVPSFSTAPCKHCGGLGVNKKPLSSNAQFADLLRKFEVEPETKPSPSNGEPIFAFAKTDSHMQELLESEDDEVRYLAEARLAVKSTLIETRAERFAAAAERGAMPVYLNHGGAHTLRPSGGDGMNWLNMGKKNAKRPEMLVLRQSILAPAGCKVVTADSSQGEARITAWLAGQQDLVDAFAQGRDIYSEHASVVYGRPVDRKNNPDDYIPGQLGKVSILGMGYGMAWYKAAGELLKGMLGADPIQFTQRDMETLSVDPSRFLNSAQKLERVRTMPSRLDFNDLLIHCVVADALVQRYRRRYQRIPVYWELMESVINAMIQGREMTFGARGVLRTKKEGIALPNGMTLHYRGIQRDEYGQASYWNGRARTHIHGMLLTENVTQCLHRLIVAEQMLAIADAGIKVALWPYDEVVAVAPADAADLTLQYMNKAMSTAPEWAPGLPLASEGGIGDNYGECK